MDFFDTMGVLLRRWYIVIPMLALTAFGALFAYRTASANFEARSTLVLVAPPAASGQLNPDGTKATPCTQNPYCSSGSLLNLANVVTRSMADPRTVNRLLTGNPGTSYQVVLDPEPSPIIEMTADGPTDPATMQALSDLSTGVENELARRQQGIGVPKSAFITSSAVTTATGATQQSGAKDRALVISIALGVVLTLVLAFVAENISRSRRRRRREAGKKDEAVDDTTDESRLDSVIAGISEPPRVPVSAEGQEHLPKDRSKRRGRGGPIPVRGRGSTTA